MTISIALNDEESRILISEAERLGIAPEEYAREAVLAAIEDRQSKFEEIAGRVLEKNRELYARLAQ